MIGYTDTDIEKINEWARKEIAQTDYEKSWYNSLWTDYFYAKQKTFKDAKPLVSKSRQSYNNEYNTKEFNKLVANLTADNQKLQIFYADETAVIIGYQKHKYIIPAGLVKIEYLKDYSAFTAQELSSIGNKEMSDAMLPADMSESSLESLEDELNDKKKQIEDAETKCKQAIEEIKKEALRKEQELKQLLEKETEKLRLMKEELENKIYILDTQIYSIRCYLGEVIDFTQITSGKPAPIDEPVIMFQKIRYLDEELGKYFSLYAFGEYEDDKDTLIQMLTHRKDLQEILCPTDRCVNVLKMSRTGKLTRTSEVAANVLEKYDYLHGNQIAVLIRDGENIFIGWTDAKRINIVSEDMFLKPNQTTVSEINETDKKSGWLDEQIKKEKEIKERNERISRYFLISILQGVIDNGHLINIPEKTKITEESDLVKFSFAEGWLKDTTYGTFEDILAKPENIPVKKGETVLTGMHVTRDDKGYYGGSTQYDAYCNNRGIGEKNRTHDAHIPAFKAMEINKTLRETTVMVTFDLYKAEPIVNNKYYFPYGNAKAYDLRKDPNSILLGTYTCEMNLKPEDFNAASETADYKKVIISAYKERMLWGIQDDELLKYRSTRMRYDSIPNLDKYGIPEITNVEVIREQLHTYISVPMDEYNNSKTRVNFEIMSDEYIRTNYLCTTWLKYVITTGNTGDFRIAGTRMSYAETLKYLNKLIEIVGKREEEEKNKILTIGKEDGHKWLEAHTDWDRILCEWKIENNIPTLSTRTVNRFLKSQIQQKGAKS